MAFIDLTTVRSQGRQEPRITLYPGRSHVHLNAVAYRAIGSPRHIKLYFDPDTTSIAVEAAPDGAGLPLTTNGLFTATALYRHLALTSLTSIAAPAQMQDGRLVAVFDGLTP